MKMRGGGGGDPTVRRRAAPTETAEIQEGVTVENLFRRWKGKKKTFGSVRKRVELVGVRHKQ